MKTLKCFAFILFISITATIISQPKDSEIFSNYLKKGRWAVQFELGTYINPSYFKSVEIAVKPQLSNSSALRFSVSANMNSSSGTTTDYSIEKPGTNKRTDLGAGPQLYPLS
jgi:hypothetical protein